MALRENDRYSAGYPAILLLLWMAMARWAQEKGEDRLFGHLHGVESVRDIVEGAAELGIEYLTLYAFSTENWDRPEYEVTGLMELLVDTIRKEVPTLNKNQYQASCDRCCRHACRSMHSQELNEALTGNIGQHRVKPGIMALSYSSRWELVNAVKNIAKDVTGGQTGSPDSISQDTLQQYLSTNAFPDPELMIRTSGEYRISNFLLYQLAYAELYFTDTRWPDFRKENLYDAIVGFPASGKKVWKNRGADQKAGQWNS